MKLKTIVMSGAFVLGLMSITLPTPRAAANPEPCDLIHIGQTIIDSTLNELPPVVPPELENLLYNCPTDIVDSIEVFARIQYLNDACRFGLCPQPDQFFKELAPTENLATVPDAYMVSCTITIPLPPPLTPTYTVPYVSVGAAPKCDIPGSVYQGTIMQLVEETAVDSRGFVGPEVFRVTHEPCYLEWQATVTLYGQPYGIQHSRAPEAPYPFCVRVVPA